MDTPSFLLQIALILVTARLAAELAAWARMPRVFGELAAGVVLGPSLLGWIEVNAVIQVLAEIGIILLLFEVGLETDVGRLLRAGGRSTLVAVTGFVVPFVLGFYLSRDFFGLSLLVSLFIAGTLTATSIGITVRILTDLGRQNSPEGQVVLGAAVLDDILGVILLAVLFDFSASGQVDPGKAGKVVMLVLGFFLLAPLAARALSTLIRYFHEISDAPGVVPVLLVSLVLAFAGLAHAIGAPQLLGGFAAGLAVSRRFFLPFAVSLRVDTAFGEHMHEQMRPVIQLFTPIFFVMVGLSIDLSLVDWGSAFIWTFSLSVAAVAILGKLVSGLLIPGSRYTRVVIGMAMVPRGEIGLIFAEIGRASGIFEADVHAALVLVIAYTTLLAPFWIKLYYRWYGHHMEEC